MNTDKKTLSYLALGDSYTIGEDVPQDQRWPVQLASQSNRNGVRISDPRIIATTGWTTDELINAINEAGLIDKYDLVSLLIGVNNQYRDYPFDQYVNEFTQLLNTAIQFAGNDPSKVFVVSIPDYGVTPFGQKKGQAKISREIDEYNARAELNCKENEVLFINITDISKKALVDPEMVASDGLHPSGKMYTEWTSRINGKLASILK